jgi:hypothetical protein
MDTMAIAPLQAAKMSEVRRFVTSFIIGDWHLAIASLLSMLGERIQFKKRWELESQTQHRKLTYNKVFS